MTCEQRLIGRIYFRIERKSFCRFRYVTTGAVYKSSFGFHSGITNKSDATVIRVLNIYFTIKFGGKKSKRISEADGLNYF